MAQFPAARSASDVSVVDPAGQSFDSLAGGHLFEAGAGGIVPETTGLSLGEILRADLYRYGGGTGGRAFLAAYLGHPGFRFSYYLRKVAHYRATRRSFGVFGYVYNRAWLNHYRFKYGFDISPTTSIEPGLYLGHFGGVVISPTAVLGANINIGQGVTIGATSRGGRKGAPTLEDRVWVGAHAIVVGRITIGHDALIAPGAYVNFDVPSGSVVLGNPGKIVSDAGSVGYINHMLPKGPI